MIIKLIGKDNELINISISFQDKTLKNNLCAEWMGANIDKNYIESA